MKFKLYRKDELTLPKLLQVVSQCHDKEALILVPEKQVKRDEATNKPTNPSMKFQGRCHKCSRPATWQKTVAVHVLDWRQSQSVQTGTWNEHQPQMQPMEDPTMRGGKQEKVQAVTHQQDYGEAEDNVFYVFSAFTSEGLEML